MKRFVLATAMALAVAATPAAAKDSQVTVGQAAVEQDRAIPVRYADLDLSRSEDAAALFSRLRYAATRACAIDEVRHPGSTLGRAIQACREAALAHAVTELNAPELTRLHAAYDRR